MEKFEKSLKLYEEVYEEDNDNLESLQFIVKISLELGKPCEHYNMELKRVMRKIEEE